MGTQTQNTLIQLPHKQNRIFFGNKMILNIVHILILYFSLAHGYEPSIGSCPDLRGIRNFAVTNYTGRWYEYSRLFLIPEYHGKCVRATYTDNHDGSVKVFNEQINSDTELYVFINGNARIVDPEYAELVVNFDTVPVEQTRPNYRVLATDYDNFAIVYDCVDFLGLAKAESLWFLTREEFPDQNLVDEGFKMMREFGLPVDSLTITDHTGCEKLPEN